MSAMSRLPAEERYHRDPIFRALVDMMYSYIRRADCTPTELREAAILAATIYEQHKTIRMRIAEEDRRSWLS